MTLQPFLSDIFRKIFTPSLSEPEQKKWLKRGWAVFIKRNFEYLAKKNIDIDCIYSHGTRTQSYKEIIRIIFFKFFDTALF